MFHAPLLAVTLRRPRLLVAAARAGLPDYRRERVLPRLLHTLAPPAPARALRALTLREAELEEARKSGEAGYSFAAHVELLIAVLAEQAALRAEPVPPATGALT